MKGKVIDITHRLEKVKPKDFVKDPLYFFSDDYWDRPMAKIFCMQTNRMRRDISKAYAEADVLTAKGDFGSAHACLEWAHAMQLFDLPEGDALGSDCEDASLTPGYLAECGKRFGFFAK